MNKKTLSTNENLPPQNLAVPFVLLAIGISWALWWAIIIAMHYGLLEYGTPMMMMFHTIAVLAPAISAIALILKSKQKTGKELVKIIFNFRQPFMLYLVVIAIALLSYLIPLIMNRATVITPLYMTVLLLPFNLVGGGLEEIGWRFLLQPTLEKKIHFIPATIITATVWTLWHLPLFFMAGTNQFTWSFWSFAILACGLSFVFAAIYRVSKSVLLCILFHTVWNAVGESIAISMDIATTTLICTFLILTSFIKGVFYIV